MSTYAHKVGLLADVYNVTTTALALYMQEDLGRQIDPNDLKLLSSGDSLIVTDCSDIEPDEELATYMLSTVTLINDVFPPYLAKIEQEYGDDLADYHRYLISLVNSIEA